MVAVDRGAAVSGSEPQWRMIFMRRQLRDCYHSPCT